MKSQRQTVEIEVLVLKRYLELFNRVHFAFDVLTKMVDNEARRGDAPDQYTISGLAEVLYFINDGLFNAFYELQEIVEKQIIRDEAEQNI